MNNKKLLGLIIGLVVGAIIYMLPFQGMPSAAKIQLALTLMTVVLWVSNVAPSGYVSAIYCALLIALNVAPPNTVFSVWLSPIVWLLIASFLIGGAVNQSGLAKRIAYAFSLKFFSNYRSIIIGVALLQLLFGLFIPNVFARCFLILAIIKEVAAASGMTKRDTSIVSFSIFAFAAPTTPVFLTSETTLNMMVLSFSGAKVSWTGWFVQMGIPGLIATAITVILFLLLFKPSEPIKVEKEVFKSKLDALGPMSSREVRMTIWLAVFVVFWCTDSLHGINIAYGTMFLAMLMGIPVVGDLIDMKTMSEIPVNMLLFLTGAMAIGSVGAVSGMNKYLASAILPSNFTTSFIPIVLFIIVISMVMHWIVGSEMAVLAVAVPTMLVYSAQMGFPITPLVLSFIVYESINLNFLVAFHNLPLTVGMDGLSTVN